MLTVNIIGMILLSIACLALLLVIIGIIYYFIYKKNINKSLENNKTNKLPSFNKVVKISTYIGILILVAFVSILITSSKQETDVNNDTYSAVAFKDSYESNYYNLCANDLLVGYKKYTSETSDYELTYFVKEKNTDLQISYFVIIKLKDTVEETKGNIISLKLNITSNNEKVSGNFMYGSDNNTVFIMGNRSDITTIRFDYNNNLICEFSL